MATLVIVDSLPALGAASNPAATAADLRSMATQMKTGMSAMSEDARLKMSRSSVEAMASSPADVDRIAAWSKATDWNTEVTAMTDMMATDLRPELNKITAPTLVLGTWVAFAQYGEAAIKQTFDTQYSALKGVKIALAPKSRHFIMYDDPQWMFAHMDEFLNISQPAR